MDWFFNQWVYGTEVPAYKFEYSVGSAGGKSVLNGRITQSGVSNGFRMRVPLWVALGKGWVRLGAATLVGNSCVDLPDVRWSDNRSGSRWAALNDVLATNVETIKR